jgi:hypothetical protein
MPRSYMSSIQTLLLLLLLLPSATLPYLVLVSILFLKGLLQRLC